jgi:hypothetical protein
MTQHADRGFGAEAGEATPESLSGDDRDSQTVFFTQDQVASVGSEEDLDVPIDEGALEAEGGQYGVERLESLTETELRDGETDDPNIAAEEGLTYVAPTDPPFRTSDGPDGIPFDEDHHDDPLYAADEVTARVREALRADAATTEFADQVHISTAAGRVILSGTVDTIDDTDEAAAVAERVVGVTEVEDRMRVRGL